MPDNNTNTNTNTITQHIGIGSGSLYVAEYDATQGLPTDAEIEVEANRLGFIKDGAELQYSPTYQTFVDDLGLVRRTKLVSEEAKLIAALIAWDPAKFDVYTETARVDNSTTGHRIVKIGGINNGSGKVYVFRFGHEDEAYGDIRITVVGTQSGGFSLAFKQDDSRNMNIEVTAQASDSEGTLIIYDEEIPA